MNSDPGAGEYCDNSHNVPDRPTMCEVRAMVCLQQTAVDSWDVAGVDWVVDKEEKQHRWIVTEYCYVFNRKVSDVS